MRRHLAGFAFALMFASASAAAVEAPGNALTQSEQMARQLLMDMAQHLAGLERFSVDVRGGYDAVQENGLKVEFLETRTLTLVRPDRLIMEETRSDGRSGMVLFDGEHVVVWDAAEQLYAQAQQPGGIDDAVVYFTRDLGMRLPLAALLTSRLPIELARRISTADYVETTSGGLFGVPAHHVVARTELVDAQIWIAATGAPWPLRMVLTYRGEAGAPDYWAEFSDWNPQPEVADAAFVFEPPDAAERIDFAIQFVAAPEAQP